MFFSRWKSGDDHPLARLDILLVFYNFDLCKPMCFTLLRTGSNMRHECKLFVLKKNEFFIQLLQYEWHWIMYGDISPSKHQHLSFNVCKYTDRK